MTIDLHQAISDLEQEKSIIFPTDTVYWIGCDATNPEALQNLLTLTQRPSHKWLIILCDSLEMIEQYAEINSPLEKLIIEELMPGALTLILDSKNELPSIVGKPNGTIWVRIPDEDVTLDLISKFWKPIATKSANITGMLPPTEVNEIDRIFIDAWITIIDGWVSDIQMPSTILRITDDDNFQILRSGSVTEEEIRDTLDI